METTSRGWLRPELLRSWTEFVLMTAFAIGIPIASSTFGALHNSSHRFMEIIVTNQHLLRSCAWEGTFLAFFLLYLSWRGWTVADLRIRPGVIGSLQGLGLYLGGYVVIIVASMYTVFILQITVHSSKAFVEALTPHVPPHGLQVSWLSIVVAMVVNAFFEEITFTAFIFTQIAERRGPVIALIFTVFLRGACHTYQDPFHLAGIVALFTCYTVVYWLTRNLWPLIFAHLLLDISTISVLKLAAH